jgi:hypothetical protein
MVNLNTTSLPFAGQPLLLSRDREGADAQSLMTLCLVIYRLLVLASLAVAALAQTAQIKVAAKSEIVEAMRKEKALDYNMLATANGARLSAAVMLYFGRRQAAAKPVNPILLRHHDYYEAFVEVSGVTRDKVPEFVRIADQYGVDQYVDPRPDKVLEKVVTGPQPNLALNVVTGWPAGKGIAGEYSYRDDSSTPPLRVTHKRITSYRLLDFGDAILFDEITGIYGRATGGALGAMFSVIGDGRAWRSFFAVTQDSWQVTRTTAKKWGLSVTQTAAVSPAGQGQKGLPDNRPDMTKIEERLKQVFEARYVPLVGANPEDWAAATGKP